MAHLLIVGEGLPEALDRFEVEMDRHSYGKGVIRLRPVRMYDIQYPKEHEAEIRDNFGLHAGHIAPDALGFSLEKKENPFKHGRMQSIFAWLIRIFGWPIGLKAPGPTKEPPMKDYKRVSTNNINFYPIAFVDDNFMINRIQGRREEWL